MSILKQIGILTVLGTAWAIWLRMAKLFLSLHITYERYKKEKEASGMTYGNKSGEDDIVSSLLASKTYGIKSVLSYEDKQEITFESISKEVIELLSEALHPQKDDKTSQDSSFKDIESLKPLSRKVDVDNEEI